MTRGDDVVMSAEDLHVLVPIFHTATACCGAATAYLLRRIAYCAGAYAPGIHEHKFHELNTVRDGGTLERVQHWFDANVKLLHILGYRLQCRRIATATQTILDWVKAGRGYRGAMLRTNFQKLHPDAGAAGREVTDDAVAHAVGITVDRVDPKADEDLVMIDPWPGVKGDAKDRAPLPAELEAACADRNFHGLIYYWVGWS